MGQAVAEPYRLEGFLRERASAFKADATLRKGKSDIIYNREVRKEMKRLEHKSNKLVPQGCGFTV